MAKTMKIGSRKDTTAVEKKEGLGINLTRPVQSKMYAFAKPGVVAAGKYTSTIVEVKRAKTNAGAIAIDVRYDLVDAANKEYHVLMRYPCDSKHFGNLIDALLAAGLSEEDDIADAVGVREKVMLEYVDGETIGSITARSPIDKRVTKKKATEVEVIEEEEDTDDEFDDFLEEADDDEEDD